MKNLLVTTSCFLLAVLVSVAAPHNSLPPKSLSANVGPLDLVTTCTGHADQEPPPPVYYEHRGYRPDWDQSSDPSLPQSYRDLMLSYMETYAQQILENAPPHWEYFYGPYVYYGGAGRSLAFLRLYKYYSSVGRLDDAASALANAVEYSRYAVQRCDRPSEDNIAFLKGQPGVYSVAAVAYDLNGDHQSALELIDSGVRQAFLNVTLLSPPFFDLGIAGLLYCARFLESYFGQVMIERELIVSAANTLYEIGLANSSPEGVLQYPDDSGIAYIGHGMGVAGILRELMLIPEITENSEIMEHIHLTVDMIVGRQEPTGQVMETQSEFIPHPYIKVQWCHGAPGQVPVFSLAAKTFPTNSTLYNECAYNAANFTLRKGALVKGMCLCHGTSGNVYMLLDLYAHTKDPQWLYNANTLLMFALDTPELTSWSTMVAWDCVPYSVFVDSVVAAMATFADFLTNIDAPENSSMPAWGLSW
ncbi:glutathione S-transferase LANCL1 [Pelomyxa schiedti]|nr:glutathione S-transferase LANCL1 [Pelomyxa schiedti]